MPIRTPNEDSEVPDPTEAWVTYLLSRAEAEEPEDEIRTLHSLVGAFEDACPDYQGVAGQDLVAQSMHSDPEIEIERLQNGLRTISHTMSQAQRDDVDASVAVSVMDRIAEGPGM